MEIEEKFYYRLPLRDSASGITRLFIDALSSELDDNDSQDIELSLYLYADGSEGTITTSRGPQYISPTLIGEYFDMVPDILFMIKASNKIINAPKRDVDADYAHDSGDPNDPGEIEVSIILPNRDEICDYIPELEKNLRGVLVHEMQHSVQKMIYGQALLGTSHRDINFHISDIYEIDARVEEVISLLDDDIQESNLSAFEVELKNYIEKYLCRNLELGKKDNRYTGLYQQMIDSHLLEYKNRLGLIKE